MKKLLVGTLALSAVSVSAPVSAQMMDGVTVSLDNLFAYKSWSDENTDSGDANNTLITNESHVVFTAEKTTDSGLTVGIYNRLESDTGRDNQEDGHRLYLSGDWGKIQTGSVGAGDTYPVSADGLVSEEGNTFSGGTLAGGYHTAQVGDTAISYHTPNVSGFKLGFSYGDAGSSSKADVTEYGFSYSTDIMGGSLSFGYAGANVSKTDSSVNSVSKSSSSYGATLVRDSLTFRLSANALTEDADNGTHDRDYSNTGIGVSYAASDDLTLAASVLTAEEGKQKGTYDETALSAVYKIAAGLTSGISYTSWEGKTATGATEEEGTYSVLWLKVAF